ncbi:MAG: N-acetylmuramoyl-L-alanine amidase [Deltaproteobacteria bacterium]|nr:N-acetylmuramoyl-L-alanine amidase [Deltaproteobacteria bacterium]
MSVILLVLIAAGGSGAVAYSPKPALQRVVIDPGHGGPDHGLRGPGGATEARLTLTMAKQLKAYLEKDLGAQVTLTRDEDVNPSQPERTAVANAQKADVFISLHIGAASALTLGGFCLYLHEIKLQAGLAVMAENSTERIDLWSLAQLKHLPASGLLAEDLKGALSEVLKIPIPPIQSAPLAVLAGVERPAVLVEIGSLTDRSAEKQWADSGYRDMICRALVHGLDTWRQRRLTEPAFPNRDADKAKKKKIDQPKASSKNP